jgi:hypothetical protein
MSSSRKLERDFVRADIAAVGTLLSQLDEEDVMARFGLEARLEELQATISELDKLPIETSASASLFFGGRPVVGTRGIESEFAGAAVAKFQDLVAKVLAHETGNLGQRGVVPRKASATLHITNIVRGSFGFLFEEIDPQAQIVDSSLKIAVDEASRLLDAFGEPDEEEFRTAVETIDQRLLATTREFFDLMRHSGATMRLLAGETDRSFGAEAVARASERAKTTTVEDFDDSVVGQLAGVLPDAHQFEFRAGPERGVIRGKIDKTFSSNQLALFYRDWVNVTAQAEMRVKRVLSNGAVVREKYTLVSIGHEKKSTSE